MRRPKLAERNLLEHALPNNLDAERAILGAILLDDRVLKRAREAVDAADFFLDENRRIFTEMLALHDVGAAIDLVTLTEELHRKGMLESAGGAAYLASLADGMPRVSNVEHYARIVREKAQLRRIAKAADRARDLALSANGDAAEALKEIGALCVGEPVSSNWTSMFHTWDDFERSSSLSFAIGGFLQNNGATMIGGLSGHGKTLILLSVVRALLGAKGKRLWDLFPVDESAVRVIYLIPESTIEPFKYRLRLFGLYDCLAPGDGRLFVRTLSKGATPCLSDPRILAACNGAHVILDTAVRFAEGEENSASDNQRGLASDIFALLSAGARSVLAAHHAPKPFAKDTTMRLENVLRGSGDVGAMLTTCWGIKQLDAASNIIHVENVKPRDFEPCRPFQLIGRPWIDQTGDFALHRAPGDCGCLAEEQELPNRGGAPAEKREARTKNLALLKMWLEADPNQTSEQLSQRFRGTGVVVSAVTVRKYRMELNL